MNKNNKIKLFFLLIISSSPSLCCAQMPTNVDSLPMGGNVPSEVQRACPLFGPDTTHKNFHAVFESATEPSSDGYKTMTKSIKAEALRLFRDTQSLNCGATDEVWLEHVTPGFQSSSPPDGPSTIKLRGKMDGCCKSKTVANLVVDLTGGDSPAEGPDLSYEEMIEKMSLKIIEPLKFDN